MSAPRASTASSAVLAIACATAQSRTLSPAPIAAPHAFAGAFHPISHGWSIVGGGPNFPDGVVSWDAAQPA